MRWALGLSTRRFLFMRQLPTISLLLVFACAALFSAPPHLKKPAAHAKSAAGKRVSTKASGKARGKGNRVAAKGPATQMTPSSDRYKEIQDALAAKGYLKSPATGVWDQESQDAMRKFQADQSLDATGKLSSLTLISLGLGPKE